MIECIECHKAIDPDLDHYLHSNVESRKGFFHVDCWWEQDG
mgnify:CR=1 FL=1